MVESKDELKLRPELTLSVCEEAGSSAQKSNDQFTLAENPKLVAVEDNAPPIASEAPSGRNFKLGRIAEYELVEELSSTPVARFYRAYSKSFQKDVAIKLIRPELCQDASIIKRFKQELKQASELDHPNLSPIYDFGVSDSGSAYIVTDLLKGSTIAQVLEREGYLDPERVLDIFKQVCHGLETLHQNNLVHRCLSPSNIVLTATNGGHDFVKVVDFGVGRFANATRGDGEDAEPEIHSDPRYMSPEQVMGYKLDARSDIYAIGLLMYECLTGRPAVGKQQRLHAIMKQLNAVPKTFRSVSNELEIPAQLEAIVFKCLEKNRSSRYATLDDLLMDLDLCPAFSVAEEKASSPKRTVYPSESARKSRRPSVFIAAAALTFGAIACTYAYVQDHNRHSLGPRLGGGPWGGHWRWNEKRWDVFKIQADTAFDHKDYFAAIEFYTRSIAAIQRQQNLDAAGKSLELSDLYTQLARSYLEKYNANLGYGSSSDGTDLLNSSRALDKALEFHPAGFSLSDKFLLESLTNTKTLVRDFDSAIFAYKTYIGLLKSSPDPQTLAWCLNGLGSAYTEKGQYREAERYLRQAVKIDDEMADAQGFSTPSYRINLASNFLAEKNWGKAQYWANENIKRLKQSEPIAGTVVNDKYSLHDNYEILAKAHKGKGKLKEAEEAGRIAAALQGP